MAELIYAFLLFFVTPDLHQPPPLVKPVVIKTETPTWTGIASWYGEADEECLGCRGDRLMANGERFDEAAMTVAFNRAPLGTRLHVLNPATGKGAIVEVTDTGGFEALGRLMDLSRGVKDALSCNGLCYVEVYQ